MSTYLHTNQYAGRLASGLNNFLRGESGSAEYYTPIADALNLELDSLEPHSSQTVYAHDTCTGIPFAGLSLWYSKRKGGLVQFPNFLSTSKNLWKGHESVYRITTSDLSQSRDISGIVGKPGEAEVLFKSNTIFQITGVSDCIELTEVSANRVDSDPTILRWFTLLDDEEVYKIYRTANPSHGSMPSISD